MSIEDTFLGDEIQCGGISASNVSAVAALSKRLLKENGGGARAKVWVNECVDPFLPAPTWCAETHPTYGSFCKTKFLAMRC